MTEDPPGSQEAPPRLVSTGFTALDVITGEAPRVAAGGTAANVAAAATALGWSARTVGTVGDDAAGRFVRKDLRHAGVDVEDLRLDPSWTTPVVLQEPGEADHVWRFACPRCGTRFAKHRPSPAPAAAALAGAGRAPDVYFFDRASLFSVWLAQAWRARGSLVVFEPSTPGRPHLFDQAVAASHLVKYSAQRAPSFEDRALAGTAAVVRTAGASGAAFRPAGSARWTAAPALPAGQVVDTAGAGDWTTAGLLAGLFRIAPAPSAAARALADGDVLAQAVADGQAWGARACGWEGARPSAGGPSVSPDAVPALYCASA